MFCLLVLFFGACVEDNSEIPKNHEESPEFSKARVWFESQNFGLQNSSGNANLATKNHFNYLEKIPDWSQVRKHSNAEGERVLEIPLNFEKSMMPKHIIDKYRSEKVAPQQLAQNLLLIEKDDGTYKSLVLKIYSETDLSVGNKKAFSNKVNYGKTPRDFTGEMIITDMNENIIRGWKIKDGKITARFKSVQKQKLKDKAMGINHSLECGFDEVDYCETTSGWFYDEEFGWDYGSVITCTQQTVITCIESDTDNDDGGGGINDEPGSGGGPNDGGGGDPDCYVEDPYFGGTWVPCDLVLDNPYFKIENNVEDPCIATQVNNAINAEFKNKITQLVWEAFGESENFNIEIEDVDYLPDSTDGEAWAQPQGDGLLFIIELNSNILSNSSKEYIMATVFHELLHAYLGYLDIDTSGNGTQHTTMANDYLDHLSVALTNYFTISPTDATHLSWGGLHETSRWEGLSNSEKNQILQTNSQYRSGQKGNPC